MQTHRKRFTLRLLIPRTRSAQRSACAPLRQVAAQARQVREGWARRPTRAQQRATGARPGASEGASRGTPRVGPQWWGKRGYYQITMILLPLHNPHKAQSHKPNCLINPLALCHNSPRAVSQFPLRHLSTPSIEHAFINQPTILHLDLLYHQGYTAWVSARPSGSSWDFALD